MFHGEHAVSDTEKRWTVLLSMTRLLCQSSLRFFGAPVEPGSAPTRQIGAAKGRSRGSRQRLATITLPHSNVVTLTRTQARAICGTSHPWDCYFYFLARCHPACTLRHFARILGSLLVCAVEEFTWKAWKVNFFRFRTGHHGAKSSRRILLVAKIFFLS